MDENTSNIYVNYFYFNKHRTLINVCTGNAVIDLTYINLSTLLSTLHARNMYYNNNNNNNNNNMFKMFYVTEREI